MGSNPIIYHIKILLKNNKINIIQQRLNKINFTFLYILNFNKIYLFYLKKINYFFFNAKNYFFLNKLTTINLRNNQRKYTIFLWKICYFQFFLNIISKFKNAVWIFSLKMFLKNLKLKKKKNNLYFNLFFKLIKKILKKLNPTFIIFNINGIKKKILIYLKFLKKIKETNSMLINWKMQFSYKNNFKKIKSIKKRLKKRLISFN